MKLIYQECSSKKACIRATFDAGSNVEFKSGFPYGIAHFCEHMIFLWTKDMTPEEVNRQIANKGAEINAGTYNNKVCVYVVSPIENIIEVAKILKKILFDGNYDETYFEKEKSVILEEELSCRDDADDCATKELYSFICSGPLSMPIIGSEKSIKSITFKNVVDFHKKYYNPKNMLLTVTGPNTININEIEEIFGKDTGTFKRSEKEKTQYTNKKKKVVIDKRIQQSRVFICYKACNIKNKDALSINYANKFFANDMDSRLFQVIRQEHGLCYYIGGSLAVFQELGWWIFTIKTAKENINKAIKLIDSEIKLLLKSGPTDEEMERAKNKYISELYSITETAYGLNAVINGRNYFDLMDLESSIERIKNMSKKEVKKVCNKYLQSEGKQIFIYSPEK